MRAALSVYPALLTWGQLGVLCARKTRGGSFNTAKKQILSGYAVEQGGLLKPTSVAFDYFGQGAPSDAKSDSELVEQSASNAGERNAGGDRKSGSGRDGTACGAPWTRATRWLMEYRHGDLKSERSHREYRARMGCCKHGGGKGISRDSHRTNLEFTCPLPMPLNRTSLPKNFRMFWSLPHY